MRWDGYGEADATWEPESNLREMTYFGRFVAQWKERAGGDAEPQSALVDGTQPAERPALQTPAATKRPQAIPTLSCE